MTDEQKALVARLRKARVWPNYSQSRVTIETAHEAADVIDAQAAEIERLRGMLKPQWFYLDDDHSSDQCRFSPYEVVNEDFFGWDFSEKEGPHLVHISTAMHGPDIWAVVRVLTDAEKDARQDDEPLLIAEYTTEEEARAALAQETQP